MEHLENEFKKRFGDQQLSSEGFDADGLWDDINKDLEQDTVIVPPPTNGLPVSQLATIVIVLIVIGILSFITITSNNKDNNLSSEVTTTPEKNQTKKYTDPSLVATNKIDKSTDIHISQTTPTLLDKSVSENKNNQDRSLAYANNNINDPNNQSQNSQLSNQQRTENQINSNQSKSIEHQSTSAAYANTIKSDISKQRLTTDQQKNNELGNNMNSTANTDRVVTFENSKVDNSITKSTSNTLTTSQPLPPQIDRLSIPIAALLYDSKAIAVSLNNAPTYHIKDHNNQFAFYASIYGGINSFTQTFSNTQSSDLVDQLNLANNTHIGTNVGLGATVRLHNKWALNTGIEYTQLWNKLDITQQNTTTRLKEDQLLKVWIQQSTGDTIAEQRGAANINVIQTRKVQHYNSYQRISIPLEFGINRAYNRWNYGINAGVAFNFTTAQAGKTLDSAGAIVDFNTNNEIASFRSFDIGFRVNASASYHITDKISLTLSPQWMRVNGNNQRTDITSTIQQFQLNIGASYRLR